MAWSLVGVGSLPTPGTTLTLVEPAGVADGDLLIACIASRSTATTAPTIAGWTAVGSQNTNNTLTTGSAIASGAMLYQIRSGTPTLAVTIPSGISVVMGQIVAYRGGAATTPLDASTAVTMAAGTAVSVTGLTTTQADDLIVAMAAGGQEAAWSAFSNVGGTNAWNSADKSANITLSGSDKVATATSATVAGVRSKEIHANGTAGKWYFEFVLGVTAGSLPRVGISPTSTALPDNALNIQVQPGTGSLVVNGSVAATLGACAANDVICFAWDAGAELVWARKNGGSWNNSGSADPATGAGGADASSAPASDHALWGRTAASGSVATIRNASADFTQSVPSGFSAWATINLGPLTASGATNTATAPSTTAWIERADNVTTTGADTSLGIFDAVRTSTGATGNLTVTASVSAGHVVIAGAFKILAASGGVTVAATGAAAGSALGTVTVDAVAPVSFEAVGVSAATALGTATAIGRTNISTEAIGAASVSILGSATASTVWNVSATSAGATAGTALGIATASAVASISTTPVGQAALSALGNVSVSAGGAVDVAPTSVTALALSGVVTVVAKQAVSTTSAGVAATALSGAATISGQARITPAGATAIVALGTATVDTVRVASVAAAGVSAGTALGGVSIAVGGGIDITPAAQHAVAVSGTVTVAAQQQVSTATTGAAAVALSGAAFVSIRSSVAASGVTAVTAVGAPSVTAKQAVTAAASGVTASTVLGGVSVAAGGSVGVIAAGQSATASVGTATVTAKQFVTVAPAGVSAATADGVAVASGKTNVTVAALGQQVMAAIGSVSVDAEGAAAGLIGVWDGSAWVDKPAKVWTGVTWVPKPVKTWNGGAWV